VLDERLSVACGEGVLRPLRLQPRGAHRTRRGGVAARVFAAAGTVLPCPLQTTIEYFGTGLVGWQRRRSALSVQAALETAIHKFAAPRWTVFGAAHRCRAMRWRGGACRSAREASPM